MKGILSLGAVLALAACASAPPKPAATPDPTLDALTRSADGVNRSIQALAEVEQYDRFKRLPGQMGPYQQVKDMGMEVTMPWDGPIEEAVRRLAQHAAYQVKVTGRQPVIPVLVKIDATPASVSDLLRNVGMQASSRADVMVYPAQRIVELRYSDAGL